MCCVNYLTFTLLLESGELRASSYSNVSKGLTPEGFPRSCCGVTSCYFKGPTLLLYCEYFVSLYSVTSSDIAPMLLR
jgi:hypothetical protein